MLFRYSTLFGLFLLAACDQQKTVTKSVSIENEPAPKATIAQESRVAKSQQELPALAGVLEDFISKNKTNWESFSQTSAVQWRDSTVAEYQERHLNGETHYRTGKILLSGFGKANLPNGKAGAEADSVEGNEGESGITLSGNANTVSSISVMKFYPSENYQEIIKQQLSNEAKVTLIAEKCLLDSDANIKNTQKNKYYRLKLPDVGELYAEAYMDEEGGQYSPGSTTFVFYREKPQQRITEMQCHEM